MSRYEDESRILKYEIDRLGQTMEQLDNELKFLESLNEEQKEMYNNSIRDLSYSRLINLRLMLKLDELGLNLSDLCPVIFTNIEHLREKITGREGLSSNEVKKIEDFFSSLAKNGAQAKNRKEPTK